jgi:hypothetical protein
MKSVNAKDIKILPLLLRILTEENWALLDLTMKRFLETLILRSEFSEIIAPFSNVLKEYCWIEL